jgi:hypothetical protein
MSQGLVRAGLGDILGPERFASAQAVYSSLQNDGPNQLCFLDEISGLLSSGGSRDGSMARQQAEALLEIYSKSGKTSGRYRLNYSSREKNVEIEGLLAFSFCGCATPRRCFKSLSIDSLEDGLFSRVNIFYREGEAEARGEKQLDTSKIDDFCAKIAQILRSNCDDAATGGSLVSTEKVAGRLAEIDAWCVDRINEDPTNDARNSFLTKVYLDSIRYALIHQASSREIWCFRDPMELDDLEYGFALAKGLALWKVNTLLDKVHHGDFETDWRDFVGGLEAASVRSRSGFVSFKAIADRRRRANNWTPKRLAEVEEFLVSTGRVIRKETPRGRLYGLAGE